MTGRARVKLEEPFAWTYTSVWDGLSDDTLNYNPNDAHPDWEAYNIRSVADARGYNQGTQLKEGSYYQYLSPGSASGMDRETSDSPSHERHKWDNGIRYENNHVHGIVWNNGRYENTGRYIGADFENLKITGNQNASNAATIYLAVIENVPNTASDNETVTHIDIGIIARAHLEAPLAYGKYYDKDGNLILTVSEENDVKLELVQNVDIDQDDIKNATLTARDKNGNELDDAYYITGYSANEHTDHSAVQVRMEGSFKVTTLDPYDGYFNRANDDMDRRAERLENQITYEVTTKEKDVKFPLIYITGKVTDPSGNPSESDYYELVSGDNWSGYIKSKDTEVKEGKTYYSGQQLYGMNGSELSITTSTGVSADFSYWGKDNECPPLQEDFEEKYPWLVPDGAAGHHGRNNESWASGAIIDNNFDTSYLPYGRPPYPGDSGMDYILESDVVLKDRILAVEVVKKLVDPNGKAIIPRDNVDNYIDLLYNPDSSDETVAGVADYALKDNPVKFDDEGLIAKQENYESIDNIKLTVPAGEEDGGVGTYYNYNVQQGMFYVKEDSSKVPNTITDADGKKWAYQETRVETEYVWRTDGDEEKMHVAEGYSGEKPDSYSGVPEVLGNYKGADGSELRNGFLEFYVYNVYAATSADLEITKSLDGYFDGGKDSNVTLTFKVSGENKKTHETYTNYAGLTFGPEDELTKTATVKDVPFDPKNPGDWEITVEEIYSSAYELADPVPAEYYEDDGIWVVEMDNTHSDKPHTGSGVVNKYQNGEYDDPNQQPAEEPVLEPEN